MDLTTIRTTIELVAFVAFCGILAWAFSSRRREDFDRASRLPFDGPDEPRAGGTAHE